MRFGASLSSSFPFFHDSLSICSIGCFGVVLLGTFAAAQIVRAADLEVTVRSIETAEGTVLVALYASAEAFTARDRFREVTVDAELGTVRVVLPDVPEGIYCVSAIHDRDGDGCLGTNWIGAPSEPYGFSRNAHGLLGPPKFDEMAIRVGDGILSIELEVY